MTTPASPSARPSEAGLDPLGGSAAVFRGRGAVSSSSARPSEAGLYPFAGSAAVSRARVAQDFQAFDNVLGIVPDLNAIDVDARVRDAHQKEKSDA